MKTGLLLQTCTAVEMARKMPGFARKYILSASTCPSTHLASIPAPHLRQLAILRGLQIVSKTSWFTHVLLIKLWICWGGGACVKHGSGKLYWSRANRQHAFGVPVV